MALGSKPGPALGGGSVRRQAAVGHVATGWIAESICARSSGDPLWTT